VCVNNEYRLNMFVQKKFSIKKGFTLIELLVVIGILAVLLAITLIAINPANQFAKANNTKRRSDVNAILNAVNQYMADYKGLVPSVISTTVRTVSSTQADLCTILVPKYIAALPVDPQTSNGTPVVDCSAAYSTNYEIVQSTDGGRITVSAPGAELLESIAVTR
jgi:prepilin-type N-terminal cleavage/methylation domain-containing protein